MRVQGLRQGICRLVDKRSASLEVETVAAGRGAGGSRGRPASFSSRCRRFLDYITVNVSSSSCYVSRLLFPTAINAYDAHLVGRAKSALGVERLSLHLMKSDQCLSFVHHEGDANVSLQFVWCMPDCVRRRWHNFDLPTTISVQTRELKHHILRHDERSATCFSCTCAILS